MYLNKIYTDDNVISINFVGFMISASLRKLCNTKIHQQMFFYSFVFFVVITVMLYDHELKTNIFP